MALDNFRTIELIWDKANKSIIKTIKTASSDTTGRYLSVKVLDGGQEVTLSNAKLQLYWEHPNFNTSGTDDFNTVNNGGLFKMTFSKEMLTNIGELTAHLILTLSDGKITSDGFTIEVIKGANDGVVVPTNGAGLVKQIDGKIDKGNVTLGDLTQEVKLAMTGGAVAVVGEDAVGTENVKDGAITLDKVSFSEISSKNMFDLESIETGMLNEDGTVYDYGLSYFTSDFMKFNPGDVVKSNLNLQSSAIYDINKKVLNVKHNAVHTQFTMPLNGYYARITRPSNLIDELMIYTGDTPTSYEPFKRVIDGEYINNVDGDVLKDKSLPIDKLNFVVQGKNLFNPEEVYEGVYVDPSSAILLSNPSYNTTHKKKVLPNEKYTVTQPRFIVFFDDNGEPLPEHSINTGTPPASYTFTVPTNAYAYQFSYPSSYENVQIEKGDIATSYEPFGYYLEGVLIKGADTETTSEDEITINLPEKLYGVVGKELSIYYNNVIDARPTGLDFDIGGSLGMQLEKRWVATPTTEGTSALSLSVFKDYKQLSKKDTILVTEEISTKDLKVLYFGDSTVNAGGVTKRLLELYSQETSNLTLLGTRGLDATNRYEGRGGWGASTYRTPTEIYGAGNPFYNPEKKDFDFAYYMTNQGYATPNHFIIQLGINDVFGFSDDDVLNTNIDKILNDFDFIINNVKAYNSSIKVGVTLTIPPNASQDAFGIAYGNGQNQWRYKRNNALWVSRLIEHYRGKESQGIYLVPMQHNIDTTTNIIDAVHPKFDGYDPMGDSVYAYLKNIG